MARLWDRPVWLLVLSWSCLVGNVSRLSAQPIVEPWQGKVILIKKSGTKIGYTDPKTDKPVYLATLSRLDYRVLKEQGDFIRVSEQGTEGWFDKSEAVLLEQAIPFFTGQLLTNPSAADAFNRRGWAHRLRDDLESALKDLDQAIRLDPKLATAYYNRGTVHYVKQDSAKAIKDFDEAIKLEPNYLLAYNNRGWNHYLLKDHDKAISDFNEALKRDPKYTLAINNRGIVLNALKQYDKAIADFDTVLQVDPKNYMAMNNRGIAKNALKQYDKALVDFDDALKLQPQYIFAFIGRGVSWSGKKQYDKALAEFNQALSINPKSAFALGNRAVVWCKFKRYDQAYSDFATALNSDATVTWLQRDYAFFRASCPDVNMRNGKDAVAFAQQALTQAGKDADHTYHSTLAAALAESGDFDKAVAVQTQAFEDKSLSADEKAKLLQRLKLYQAKQPYRDLEP